MKRLVVACALLFLISGCAYVQLTKDGAAVKVADPSQIALLTKCKSLGQVNSITDQGKQKTIENLKNETAERHGNIVLSRLQPTQTANGLILEISGVAYACPKSISETIIDASML